MDRHDVASLTAEVRRDLVVLIHNNSFDRLRADSRAYAGKVANRGVSVALDEGGWST